MGDINNIYRGQYKEVKGMKQPFDAFWSRYGVDSKNDLVKDLFRAVYEVLDEDILKSLEDDNVNQNIFDRVEFRDLTRILGQTLSKYLEIEDSDIRDTTDAARTQFKNGVEEQIQECLNALKTEVAARFGKNGDDAIASAKKRIDELLTGFFKTAKSLSDGKGPRTGGDGGTKEPQDPTDTIRRMKEILSGDEKTQRELGRKMFSEVKDSKEFLDFSKKLTDTISGAVNAATQKNIAQQASQSVKIETPDDPAKTQQKEVQTQTHKKQGGENQKTDRDAEEFAKTVDKEITESDKRQSSHAKLISKQFNVLKNSFMQSFKIVKWIVSPLLGPIARRVKATFNAIVHPLDTLTNLFKKNWVKQIAKIVFSNPATMYMLGYLMGFVWNRWIEEPMHKYVVNPILRFRNALYEKYVLKAQKSNMSELTKKIEDIKKFFTLEKNENPLFGLMLKLGEITGFRDMAELRKTLNYVGGAANWILNGMTGVITNGWLPYYRGAPFLQRLLMLYAAQSGIGLAGVLQSDDDAAEKGTFRATKAALNSDSLSDDKYYEQIEDRDKAKEAIKHKEEMEAEHQRIGRLLTWMQYYSEEGAGKRLTMDNVKDFFSSDLFDEEELKRFLTDREFNELTYDKQMGILRQLVDKRKKRVDVFALTATRDLKFGEWFYQQGQNNENGRQNLDSVQVEIRRTSHELARSVLGWLVSTGEFELLTEINLNPGEDIKNKKSINDEWRATGEEQITPRGPVYRTNDEGFVVVHRELVRLDDALYSTGGMLRDSVSYETRSRSKERYLRSAFEAQMYAKRAPESLYEREHVERSNQELVEKTYRDQFEKQSRELNSINSGPENPTYLGDSLQSRAAELELEKIKEELRRNEEERKKLEEENRNLDENIKILQQVSKIADTMNRQIFLIASTEKISDTEGQY